MRNLAALIILGTAAVFGTAVQAADAIVPVYKDYIPPEYPEVDQGLKGSFYLRGSVGGNAAQAREINHPSLSPDTYEVDEFGYGYSAGVGAGYETGTGIRADVTVDYLKNDGMSAEISGAPTPGTYELNLRSTIALANVYYDFGLSDIGLSAAGGAFGYVGAGAGVAFNTFSTDEPGGEGPEGSNTSFAAAAMAGVGYDFGNLVADVGYRGLYINRLENNEAPFPYSVDDNFIHEVRGTLRYRFN